MLKATGKWDTGRLRLGSCPQAVNNIVGEAGEWLRKSTGVYSDTGKHHCYRNGWQVLLTFKET